MALSLLGLLPGVLRTVARVLKLDAARDVADAITNAQMTPEQQAELQATLLHHEQAMKALSIEELKTLMLESVAMVASEDKYVRRARPTGLYIFYIISAALAVALLLGKQVDPTAILTVLAPLAGVGGTYVISRTREKLNGGGHE